MYSDHLYFASQNNFSLVLGVRDMEASKDFTKFVKKYSQTLAFERSFCDMIKEKNDRRPRTNSYTQAIFILAGNDDKEGIRFSSLYDNAIPLVFNMRWKTYKKAKEFPLTSPLTILFWDASKANLVVQEVPLKKSSNLMLTCLKPAWDDHLEVVNPEVWKNKSEASKSSDTSKNCSIKPFTICHIRKDRQPLTLAQLCYAEWIANTLDKYEEKQLIDIGKVMQGTCIKMSMIYPSYYEIVSVLNPMIVKSVEHYDLPVRKYMSFKNKLKILFKTLKQ
jgi:hypothetical protein